MRRPSASRDETRAEASDGGSHHPARRQGALRPGQVADVSVRRRRSCEVSLPSRRRIFTPIDEKTAALNAELGRCDLVCAPCHSAIHAEMRRDAYNAPSNEDRQGIEVQCLHLLVASLLFGSVTSVDGAHNVSDSHEWEETCKQLLAIKYGAELQLIDAARKGDLGLEAFARDARLGFQCYAPLEPLSAKGRYEKQRDKLTSDLNKLVTNVAALTVILGETRLDRYVFMVPRFDVTLLEHCGEKASQMRDRNLAILTDAFDIVVHTDANYPTERAQLIETALAPLQLEIEEVGADARTEWATAHVSLVDTLTAKIAKLNDDPDRQIEMRDEFLDFYLRREQILSQVLAEAPETHVRLMGRIRERERLLAMARLTTTDPPLEHATSVVSALTAELMSVSKALQPTTAEALAYGTAADWMLRCPLDFN